MLVNLQGLICFLIDFLTIHTIYKENTIMPAQDMMLFSSGHQCLVYLLPSSLHQLLL